jgi:hypothetical protein
VDQRALDLPAALAVPEGGDGADRRQQQRILPQLLEQRAAHAIPLGPCIQQRLGSQLRGPSREAKELAKDRAQIRFAPAKERFIEHRSALHEEEPPQPAGGLERGRPEAPDAEALPLEDLRRTADGLARLRGHGYLSVILQPAHCPSLCLVEVHAAIRDRRAPGVQRVGVGEQAKEKLKIRHGPGHGTDGTEDGEGTDAGWPVAARRHTSGSGLEGADAAEVGRLAHRAPAVAAQPASGEARGDGRSLAPA